MKLTIDKLLSTSEHRAFEYPKSKWRFYQEWNNAVFLHWKVDVNVLRQFVPDQIEIDLFEGDAWFSLVAFRMEKMRPRYLPSVNFISDFEEINIRTYIKTNNKGGVHFLSIEADNNMSCLLARKVSKLPYRFSKMKRDSKVMESTNVKKKESFRVEYAIGEQITSKSELELWLTERYALCQDDGNQINEFDIHHIEWPVFKIEIDDLHINYPRFDSLIGRSPDLIQYSTGVQVLAWPRSVIT